MTVLCAILALSTVLAWCGYEFYRNRATNLEIINSDLRDQLCDAYYRLDDAVRDAARLRVTQDYLIRENTTLLTDLMHTERICQYYRSRRRRNKEQALSLYLLGGAARPNKKAHLMAMESRP